MREIFQFEVWNSSNVVIIFSFIEKSMKKFEIITGWPTIFCNKIPWLFQTFSSLYSGLIYTAFYFYLRCDPSNHTNLWHRIKIALSFSHQCRWQVTNHQNEYNTVSQKKKVLSFVPMDSGSWRPIKQSLIRQFFVSRQEGIFFWPFEVSAFSYFVIIF